MSLYNMLFGTNPFSSVLLQILGTTSDAVPRFRDCYLSEDGTEIIIHTRTGGGNRDFYENPDRCRERYPKYFTGGAEDPTGPWNCDLRTLPNFKFDADDSFDCTYANFHYAVPEALKEPVAALKDLGAVTNPAERWQKVLDGIRRGDISRPEVQRAIGVGESIMGKIRQAMEEKP